MTELPPEGLASRLATEADRCVLEGQREKASELYARAAELTREALERAPKDAFKSRALFMVNIPMLLFKAQRYAEAEQAAREYMAAQPTPSAGVLSRLREVAFNSWQALSVMQAEELESVRSIASCELSLEGGAVRWGLAPLDEVIKREASLRELFHRSAEYLEGLPYRARGAPPPQIQRAAQLYASAGGPGSYRVRVKVLSAPEQLELESPTKHLRGYGEPLVHQALQIVREVIDDEYAGNTEVDPHYRISFMRIVRDLAPDGQVVRSAELAGGESTWIRTRMTAEARPIITRAISEIIRSEGLVQVTGTLVGMWLETEYLSVEIKQDQGKTVTLRAPKNEGYEERVGALWTRKVIASGRLDGSRSKPITLLSDIDAVGGETSV